MERETPGQRPRPILLAPPGTEQGPVLVGERWSVDLAAQGCELVALVLAARGRGLYRLETSDGHS